MQKIIYTQTLQLSQKLIQIIDLNVKCKTIKLLGDDIAENLDNLGFGD